ncbi:hypothetical protein COL57_15845 [Bacillus wiedmannii]|nr:hypothetical protein COL57_15845 [Bacillus wiedmannii]
MASSWAQKQLEQLQKKIFYTARGKEWVEERIKQNTDQDYNYQKHKSFYEGTTKELMSNLKELGINGEFSIEVRGTVYESPYYYQVMMDLLEKVESASKELGFTIPDRPIIGTLPTGKIQAMASRHPISNEHTIIFEYELFSFANLLSKSLLSSLPVKSENGVVSFSTDLDDIVNGIAKDQTGLHKFFDVLVSYLFYGRPSLAEQYNPDKNIMILNALIVNSMELFVMGHEYSHILLDHTNKSKEKKTNVYSQSINELIFQWEDEFEADGLSFIMIMEMISQNKLFDLSLQYVGVDFFFSCLSIMDRAVSLVLHGKEVVKLDDSHPPVDERREYIRYLLKRLAGEEKAESAILLAKVYQMVLENYYQQSKPILLRHHKEGTPLAKSWLK